MKFISEKKISLLYFLAACLTVLVLVFFYYNTQKIKSASKLVVHTQEVLRTSDNVPMDILNFVSSARGYLLTGNVNFLEPFYKALDSVNGNIAKLAMLTRDNPGQQKRIDTLKLYTEDRIAIIKQTVEKWNSLNNSSKEALINNGQYLNDKIRFIIANINTEEFRLLKQRKLDYERSNKNSGVLFFLLFIVMIVNFALIIVNRKNQKIRKKFAEELKQSNELFSNLFNYNPAAIALYRYNNGKIIKVNNSFLQLVGITNIDDVIDKTFDELNVFVNPNYGNEIRLLLKENKVVKDFETKIQTRQGEIKWTSASILFIEVDDSPCVFFVSIDITNRKKAEKQLAAVNKEIESFTAAQKIASQYTRSLIEASRDPLFTISPEGKITDINNASIKITEQTREQLIGSDFFNYFTEPEKAREGYKQVFANGFVTDYPLTIKDGKLTQVMFNGSIYKDDVGNVLGVVIVARDVTAQNLLSNYSLSLIEASLDPLVTISTEGKITDMNEAFVNITGRLFKILKGTDFFDYFTDPQMAREVYQEVFAKGFVADSPLTIRHIDGKLTDVLFNGSVYKDGLGNVLGVVIVARDTTEQKRIESELVEAKVFAELATDLAIEAKGKAESATQIAENAVKAKQQFLSNMSHEIRTPMNAIIGFTKVVLKTDLSAKQKEYLNAIKLSGDSLIVLINDILDLAKVDAGKMKFEKIAFKMTNSISAMIHLFETKILEKNLQLIKKYDSKIPKVLVGDPVRLHQIILNLVSNAIKFTNKGEIKVNVQILNEDEENVNIEFAVSDTGIGIPEDRIVHIFENFQQATSETSRLYGGTGLGLAIAKQLVESQGGTIGAKSQLGKGSTFTFILPFQKTKGEAASEIESVQLDANVKGLKVLVVEDIALNQLLMKTLLDDFEFEHDIAANGKIAIEKLQTKEYDIILMDLQMPEMNGFEATEYIRNKMNLQIPIIALTADVTTVDLDKCKAVGMNDYISKPIDENLLYCKIVDLLKISNSIKEEGYNNHTEIEIPLPSNDKYVDLAYMKKRTKDNPKLILEMISLYLKQTSPLINSMKKGLLDNDWNLIYSSVHKLIPSFSIIGMSKDYENMAKKIQEYASTQQHLDELPALVLKLEDVCSRACEELGIEQNLIKNKY